MTILNSAEATQAEGEKLARLCQGGEIIALYGVLGAGKTQFVKGFARGLKFPGDVTSPTYTLVHEYLGGRMPLYHLDLYRIETEEEAKRFGVDEYLPADDGITIVEWAEHIRDLLPAGTIHIELVVASLTERIIRQPEVASEVNGMDSDALTPDAPDGSAAGDPVASSRPNRKSPTARRANPVVEAKKPKTVTPRD